MSDLEIISGSRELLKQVQPLWEKLNDHHRTNSQHFSHRFRDMKFEVRKNKFINDEGLEVKIDLVKDNENNSYIAYCISTINKSLIGEIDSIYIDKEYRKYGLGDKLMKRSLKWMDSNKVETKTIVVAEGNENVLEFYKRYGFHKKKIILEQVNA